MRKFTLNEVTLSRILHEAQYNLVVSDESEYYEIPLQVQLFKSSKHFIAKRITTLEQVVLKYSDIRWVKIDYARVLDCA